MFDITTDILLPMNIIINDYNIYPCVKMLIFLLLEVPFLDNSHKEFDDFFLLLL